jgi:hypothetical protein
MTTDTEVDVDELAPKADSKRQPLAQVRAELPQGPAWVIRGQPDLIHSARKRMSARATMAS